MAVGLWFAGLSREASAAGLSVLIPLDGAIAATVTAILSGAAYAFTPKKHAFSVALGCYLLLAVTAFLIINGTGHMSSPFIAVWMLVAVFGGLFGIYALGPLLLLAIGYGAYLFSLNLLSVSRLTMFGLAFGLPIVISHFIWHQRKFSDNEKEKAMDALAQELDQVANKSEIVINAIADGVIAIDQKGIIQLINPAAQNIIGWDRQDALALDYRSIFKILSDKSEPLNDTLDPVQSCLRENKSIMADDYFLQTNSGKKINASIHVSPLNSESTGAIIVFRDITQEKADEREQAEFVSTASHEMRTPVAAIEGYLGLALNPQTAQIDAKARTYLEKAHESAQHLGRLFQDLLDVSRAEDGRLKVQPTVIDSVGYIRDIVTTFQAKAKDKSVSLIYKPETTSSHTTRVTPQLYALADQDHFREIVGNLVENAIKYTKAGDVTVDVTGDNEHVTVSVQDTGIGIPAEDITHLFQKFYRVDNTDTREIGGTGLGLYLCRRLAEAMNGRVYVKSDYGNGSTFFLEVPRVSAEDAAKFVQSADNPAAQTFPLSTGTQPAAPPVTSPSTSTTPTPAVAPAVAPTTPAAAPAIAPAPAPVTVAASTDATPPVAAT
jgi:PAS domain S-box-containing protein